MPNRRSAHDQQGANHDRRHDQERQVVRQPGDVPQRGQPRQDPLLRRQLAEMLDARGAHMPFETAVADFPADALNRQVPNGVYTPWHLLEHIRIAQAEVREGLVEYEIIPTRMDDIPEREERVFVGGGTAGGAPSIEKPAESKNW